MLTICLTIVCIDGDCYDFFVDNIQNLKKAFEKLCYRKKFDSRMMFLEYRGLCIDWDRLDSHAFHDGDILKLLRKPSDWDGSPDNTVQGRSRGTLSGSNFTLHVTRLNERTRVPFAPNDSLLRHFIRTNVSDYGTAFTSLSEAVEALLRIWSFATGKQVGVTTATAKGYATKATAEDVDDSRRMKPLLPKLLPVEDPSGNPAFELYEDEDGLIVSQGIPDGDVIQELKMCREDCREYIMDIGMYSTKGGYLNDALPTETPSIIGTAKNPCHGRSTAGTFVGESAHDKCAILNIRHVFRQGSSMDEWKSFIHHLRLPVTIDTIVIILSNKNDRYRTLQVIFEMTNATKIICLPNWVANVSHFGLYMENGIGTLVDFGWTEIRVICFADGVKFPKMVTLPYGAKHAHERFHSLMSQKIRGIDSHSMRRRLSTVLDSDGWCALNPAEELRRVQDGEGSCGITRRIGTDSVDIDEELFLAPEVIFDPVTIGQRTNVVTAICQTIEGADAQLINELSNVYMTGHFSCTKQLGKRLEIELRRHYQQARVHVDGGLTAWRGARQLTDVERERYTIEREDFFDTGILALQDKDFYACDH